MCVSEALKSPVNIPYIPARPVARNLGLLCFNDGILLGVEASCFGLMLLGFSGRCEHLPRGCIVLARAPSRTRRWTLRWCRGWPRTSPAGCEERPLWDLGCALKPLFVGSNNYLEYLSIHVLSTPSDLFCRIQRKAIPSEALEKMQLQPDPTQLPDASSTMRWILGVTGHTGFLLRG